MDGVIRFYMDGMSTTEGDGATSPTAGHHSPTASQSRAPAVIAADTSPTDHSSTTTGTDSNANIVDVQTDAVCRETVITPTPQWNSNVEEDVEKAEKQMNPSSSPQSSVMERLDSRQFVDKEDVRSRTLPTMTAAGRRLDVDKARLSDSECSSLKSQSPRSQSCAKVSSVTTAMENSEPGRCLRNLPDSCSGSLPALLCSEVPLHLSLSSQTSPKPVEGRPAVPSSVASVSTVKSQLISAKQNFDVNLYMSKKSPSNSSLKTVDSSCTADISVKEDATSKADCDVSCQHDNSASVCQVPAVSLSCSSLVDRFRSYVPSPGPLTQMYGGNDVQVTTDCASQTSTSSASSPVRNSLLLHSPLKVGGDLSEITAKISAARSCSRNAVGRPLTVSENFVCQSTDGFRTPDSRSTPWLATAENLRSPSVVLGLPHSSSVSATLADSSSLALSSNVSSSPSMTSLASRCSSLVSNDSSTLRTSTLVPDNSCKFLHHSCNNLTAAFG